MSVTLLALPYDAGALAPHLSRASVQLHHAHHHRIFAETVRTAVTGTTLERASLEDIIVETAGRQAQAALFQAAAETWNHNFYFRSMRPGGGVPSGLLAKMIDRRFGGFEGFSRAFVAAATSLIGSGWAWLVVERGSLAIRTTANSDTPIAFGETPLLGLDLWEHAYVLDHQGRRADYVRAFLKSLANWEFAGDNLDRLLDQAAVPMRASFAETTRR